MAGAMLLAGVLAARAETTPSSKDQAYGLNREGMIAMSEARFTDAIDAFHRAAELADDYSIPGKPLMYTPVFMTGWASEKIARTREACAAYRRYLRLAVEHPAEPTKVEHANGYISANCQSTLQE